MFAEFEHGDIVNIDMIFAIAKNREIGSGENIYEVIVPNGKSITIREKEYYVLRDLFLQPKHIPNYIIDDQGEK